jgi:Peptidase family S41/Tricorn protease C1 domain
VSGRALRWLARPAVLAALVGLPACADSLLTPELANTPPRVATEVWTDVDEYYPFFGWKHINWDSIGSEYVPRVTASTDDHHLFGVLSIMLSKLKDGHVTLDAPGRHYEYDGWYEGYPVNFSPPLADAYLGVTKRQTGRGDVIWGYVAGGVGYLRITTFFQTGVAAEVDSALAALGDSLRGLLIDVRSNGGGLEDEARAAAGHFTKAPVLYGYHRYKSGPGHDEFGPSIQDWVEPKGPHGYYGPMAVLTNRGVYSAAEDFVLAMRALPKVTTVGDTTGGGSGDPIARELPNGWILHVPRWQVWGVVGTVFEGIGLAPEHPVRLTDTERAEGRDPIIERGRSAVLAASSGNP